MNIYCLFSFFFFCFFLALIFFFFFKQKTAYEMLRSLVGLGDVYKRQGHRTERSLIRTHSGDHASSGWPASTSSPSSTATSKQAVARSSVSTPRCTRTDRSASTPRTWQLLASTLRSRRAS